MNILSSQTFSFTSVANISHLTQYWLSNFYLTINREVSLNSPQQKITSSPDFWAFLFKLDPKNPSLFFMGGQVICVSPSLSNKFSFTCPGHFCNGFYKKKLVNCSCINGYPRIYRLSFTYFL